MTGISPYRTRVFIRFALIFFVMLVIVFALHDIPLAYFPEGEAEYDKDRLLRILWIIPLASVGGGFLAALLSKKPTGVKKD